MRLAFLADLHGNREAVSACLAHARGQGIDRYVLLGDYVGYGADPHWVLNQVMDLVAGGAIALLGNHDAAIFDPSETMNSYAMKAIEWTRTQLSEVEKQFLAALPMQAEDEDRLYVHADLLSGRKWHYLARSEDAARNLHATHQRSAFCGHVHIPAVYGITGTGKLTRFNPLAGVAVPLMRHRRWLSVMGSVGQPRDGNPAACYAVFDTARDELTYLRVPYDVEAAAAKIRAAGLPEVLATRLFKGH